MKQLIIVTPLPATARGFFQTNALEFVKRGKLFWICNSTSYKREWVILSQVFRK